MIFARERETLDERGEKLRVAINGFGRMGRSIARVILQSPDVELVGINDVSSWEVLHYLFQNDSVHRKLSAQTRLEGNTMYVNDTPIALFSCANPQELDFGEVDVVIESSGRFLTQELTSHHLSKGAKRVILSAPSLDDTPTFVLGVNAEQYQGQKIISNASCTTNALAPICKIIDKHFGIESGILSTIHSYTNDQNLLDNAHRSDFRRSRCAGLNIIPTSTGSAKALHRVLPNLKGKMHGHSLRVPVADVSMVDLALKVAKKTNQEELNALFESYIQGEMSGILGFDEEFRVSSDFIGNPLSSIIAKDLSFTLQDNHLKIMAWYDNEWGYANRIVEMARFICD